jgi:2'-5' RNA ligase
MPSSVRSFLALPSTDEVRSALGKVVARLAEARADVRWERTEKLHITLKFLGQVEMPALDALGEAVVQAVAGIGAFDVVYEKIGGFPSVKRPRIIWAGARKHEVLRELQKRIESECLRLAVGKPEDRPFHPHITIGRVKSERGMSRLTATLKSITFQPVSARCSEILLMRSELHPAGSRYYTLRSIPLTS